VTTAAVNTLWAGVFLDELARAGVRELCIAPGSRSTPLVLAAVRDGRFRTYSVVDERSAGFFALGMGKASGRPAGVVTTSGTAAANLYPAVIEASQGEVPLLVLTADRPHHLRDTDGNQAMDQLRLFGVFPRGTFEVAPPRLEGHALRHLRSLAARAVAESLGPPRGPVHLNFPFEKPLEPPAGGGDPASEELLGGFQREHPGAAFGRAAGEPFVRVSTISQTVSDDDVERLISMVSRARRGVIVAGPTPDDRFVGPAVVSLGDATGFPVLADPLSGARFLPGGGATVVGGYDLFLRSPRARETLAPDLVLRVGGSLTSSGALEYMAEQGNAPQVVMDDGHRWKDHLASAHAYLPTAPAPLLEQVASRVESSVDPEWLGLWRQAESGTREVLAARREGALLEGEIAEAVVSGLPEGANLLVASSMPIRDLDAFAFPREKSLRVFGNRGVSGIDGLVSTTLGIAMASAGPEETGGPHQTRSLAPVPTAALLGDLAFFHDMNGLLALRDLRPRVVLVVVNNDGGGIFHTLPVREHEPAFTRFFATPHGLDFRRVADLYDLHHAGADSLEGFRRVFAESLGVPGPSIVEVRTRREDTHAVRRDVVAAVVGAMEKLGRGPEA